MSREPQLGVVVGKKGVGKTHKTKEVIQQYILGGPNIKPRRALILDVNDEFTGIKSIALKDIALFSAHPKIEARRVRPFLPNGKKMTIDEISQTLFVILEKFRGGLLLIEDINKYTSDNMPNDLIGAICTNRHADMDIIIHYQSIGRISPKVWQNLNWIRFHQNTDSVDRHKLKFEDKFDVLKLTEILVNNACKKDKRYYVYVNVDEMKIKGSFPRKIAEETVMEYVQINYSKLINPLTKQRDMETGKPRFDSSTAQKHVMSNLLEDYF